MLGLDGTKEKGGGVMSDDAAQYQFPARLSEMISIGLPWKA